VVRLITAKTLGLKIPPKLLVLVDGDRLKRSTLWVVLIEYLRRGPLRVNRAGWAMSATCPVSG
jgi:hypothetical protein